MNSAASVSETTPEAIMSYSQFSNERDLGEAPTHWTAGLADWFTGQYSQLKSDYEAYLQNMNILNEAKATQSARAWEEYMDSTKYQRAFKDLERAGVNPYLLVNGGAAPGVGSSSSPKASYPKASTKDAPKDTKGRDFALILLAVARLAAAFI